MANSDVEAKKRWGRTKKSGSGWANFLLLSVATIVAVAMYELGLRVWDDNPVGTQQPDNILELLINAPVVERMIDVSLLDSQQPTSRLRVDARSYIQPSFQ